MTETPLKREQLRWEPWKVIAVTAGAASAGTLALVGVITAIVRAVGAH